MPTPIQSRTRRGAHTPRGRETRAAILRVARKSCSEQWLDQLSLAELARAGAEIRGWIVAAPLPPALDRDVAAGYAALTTASPDASPG